MQTPDWMARGQRHIWLPYAQMKTATPPLPVVRSHGSRLELADGRQLIDGVASWWTACHGYNHPHIARALREQLDAMPHVMFGGLTHEPALTLARRLAGLLGPGLDRVFYTDSGSVAVEVAMKMAVQFWLNQGERGRSRFLAFRGGYHGDTLGTMAVCDPDEGMHSLFRGMLAEHDIVDLPRDDAAMARLDAFLETRGPQLAGILVEPLVQGAGGMLLHEPQVLRRLRRLADRHGLLLIFDEIFTGFGRTGTMFAFEQAGARPDIITLSKALTGGTLPLAATVASSRVFDAFWSDDPSHALMHGPTFMGNAMACAAANASLDLFESEPRLAQAQALSVALARGLAPCRELPWVRDVRVLGAIGVVELDRIEDREALKRRLVEAGVWVRPFGNVVYLTPALTIAADELDTLMRAVVAVLRAQRP
ncbi:adenosylmethionine--8-amino-7-oxononanoate transaminase [Achromobacter xylosoxidans]|jgi:adenosylmethionine-8-amino-7-oxononanoate aminotransferase|uniref:Adenosylmethionine-8-amino-7-oxononanoate aminotransferase n=1 Tax=Alcaligenes xylosoxydans xylosoxydans TaxID=85698 RepID=A0A9X3L1P4_ALCXX|nr:adenosylmethionine--8-amino-7-oxononanoate transaminase [Achromobacter xylosoxidans]MCH1987305.1 adenosylmethionine--8-amino-7-oxononanoate transaminase [Achromobacter xylosoxidans]MCH4590216.1 adenosylmethionine--8-amino-7-oxononanoate transaminase [Achromobacter xylosoxidans]MCZ8404079.1 adenosylmethionine--8-amino-7-oxononanoate transaminase [Achromobacter xylosoxidans]MDC6165219.1 adenosylmethionine--8-amino-7-oxononanoate transaminase [Achromobacter xylosoxidans]CUJ18358.1 Adenosylmeth